MEDVVARSDHVFPSDWQSFLQRSWWHLSSDDLRLLSRFFRRVWACPCAGDVDVTHADDALEPATRRL